MHFFGIDLIELVRTIGYFGVWGIIFAETGIFFCFFFPGDSLLFVAGFLSGTGLFSPIILILGTFLAAVLGNFAGYQLGKFMGPRIFTKEDSLLFRKAHVIKAQKYYDKYGPKTIFLACFVPVVRTFSPIVAGIAQMDPAKFWFYNILGALAWAGGITFAGYYLGSLINVDTYILPVTLLIIFLSVLPGIIEFWKVHKLARKTKDHEVLS